ncbi:RimK family alpha-L-glutamate ligase [Sporosarcina siberiensis]|uniref:RimK family alpha-L-glutamate ligase n=1 Tax=Sporosarcina siberiensis TaxID=1365606 RepID=A0ABW4SF91_9BACL
MKGYVYYTRAESKRNQLFIDDLIKEAKTIGIQLELLVDDEVPSAHTDFILFRDRISEKSKSFEELGIKVFNRSEVIRIANHKLRTFELASLLGIPAVPTKRIQEVSEINEYPVVLKTVDGHGGNEVFLCSTDVQAEEFFAQFSESQLIVQPFIESGARDVRVFVVGGDIVGAVKRTGNGSFKSNYTLGGSVERYELRNWQIKEVQTLVKAIKSDYVGIDFLLLSDGRWLLNEIEDPVGARSLYKTHDFSIATKLMHYIKKQLLNE